MHNPWKYRILVNRKAPYMATMHEAYNVDPELCLAMWENIVGRAEAWARHKGKKPETHEMQKVRARYHYKMWLANLGRRDGRDRRDG